MEGKYRQWIAAFVMGMIVPGLLLRLGAGVGVAEKPDNQESAENPQDSVIQQDTRQIPVLHDGVLQSMDLEEYLFGVVLAEMPASFETDALKAQAVAARTCTLYCTSRGTKHENAAVCTDSNCCQAYLSPEDYKKAGGEEESFQKVRKAVYATAGQVLTYEGALIDATYFSCSGGRTEDAAAVWGGDVPYLQSVESPGEEKSDDFYTEVTFTPKEFSALLGRSLSGTPQQWLGSVVRTQGGGVQTMVIAGKTYTGRELRQMLKLNSTAFTMEVSGGNILVKTSGRGHRVGMSQYGADAMAATGSSYGEILAYYYRGAELTNWAQ